MKLQKVLFATLLPALLPVAAWAQESHSAEQRARMFDDYLVKCAAQITRSNLADIKDLSEWKRRRPEVRRQLLYMLGLDPVPQRTPLRARITRQFERDTYRVESIVFESLDRKSVV